MRYERYTQISISLRIEYEYRFAEYEYEYEKIKIHHLSLHKLSNWYRIDVSRRTASQDGVNEKRSVQELSIVLTQYDFPRIHCLEIIKDTDHGRIMTYP